MRLLGIPRHFMFFLCFFGYKGGSGTTCQCLYFDKQYLLVGFFDIRDEIITFTSRIPSEESCEIRKPDLNQAGFHWDLLFGEIGSSHLFYAKDWHTPLEIYGHNDENVQHSENRDILHVNWLTIFLFNVPP